MRLTTILILIVINITATGQSLIGKYNAYYGHALELRADSTFRYEWSFDLASSWSTGQWKVSNKTVYLNIKCVYDTLTRDNKADSLVLSADEKSNRVKIEEFAVGQISGGGQGRNLKGIPDRLVIKGKRLYHVDKNGQIIRTKESGILTKKKRPTYYFRTS